MKVTELFEAIADQITHAVKQPFRDEPITEAECEEIQDRLFALLAEERSKIHAKSK